MSYRTSGGMMLSRNPSCRLFAPLAVTFSTTHRARSGNVSTLTFVSHKMSVGDYVSVATVGGTGYNGWSQITSVTATQITYANTGGNEGTTVDAAGRVSVNRNFEHINVTPSMSISEVQHLLDSFPKRRRCQVLIVRFADGTYNWAGPLRVQGFQNASHVVLEGNQREASGSRRTDQAAILNFSGPEGILVEDCNTVYVNKTKIITVSSATDGYCVKVKNCHLGVVQDCFLTGSSTNYGSGFQVENSYGKAYYTVLSTLRYSFHAKGKSYLLTQGCGTSGTAGLTGWRSDDASWISGGDISYMGYTTQSSYGTYNSPWFPNTYYSLGTFVSRRLPGGVKFECTRAGTSGSSEPTWPGVGSTANDPDVSGVQWTGRYDSSVSRLTLGSW